MKTKILAAIAVCAGLFGGCDSSDPVGSEGGRTLASLDSMPLSKDVKDTMNGASIGYRLAVQKDSVYAVSLALITDFELIQKAGYNPFLRLSILAPDKDSVLISVDGTSNDFSPSTRIVAPATGYLRIKVGGVDGDGLCAFNLRVDPLDRYETDDVASQAVLVPTDSSYSYRTIIDAVWDVDWIRFRTIPGSVYELILTESRAKASIYRSDKSTLLTTRESGDAQVFRFMALDTLTYASFTNESNSSVFGAIFSEEDFSYGVAVAEKAGDRFEPDNSVRTASSLGASVMEQIRTASGKDDDFVRLGVVANHTYEACFKSDVALLVDVLASDSSRVLNQWKIPAGTSIASKTIETRANDSLVLRIRSEAGKYGYYELSLFEVSGEVHEPDSLGAVRAILTTDGAYGRRFLSKGDVDWFSFQADSGKTYRIVHSETEIDSVSVSLRSSDSTPVSGDFFRSGSGLASVFVCRKSGTYFYSVSDADSTLDSRKYTTGMTKSNEIPAWFTVADPLEPDDGISSASELRSDSAAVDHSLPIGDEDWSRIALDSGRTYLVELVNTGTSSVRFQLFASDSVGIGAATVVAVGKSARLVHTARAAEALLALAGARDSASRYAIRAWAVARDSSEPDNDIEHASEIAAGPKSNQRILDGDPDWFRIRLDSTGRYLFGISRQDPGTCVIDLAVYGRDSGEVLASKEFASNTTSVLAFAPERGGDYHLKASVRPECAERGIPYRLTAMPDPEDAYEFDNTLATAKVIRTDSSVQKRTVAAGNDDLIRIDIDSGASYELRVASLDSRQQIDVVVLRADSSLFDENYRMNALRLSFSGSRRTTYYVKVRSSDGAAVPFPYTVAVKGSVAAKEVKLSEGPIRLEGDGVRLPLAFVMGDSMEVKMSFKDGMNYDLNFRSDVELRYTVYQEGFQSPISQGTTSVSSSSGLRWTDVSESDQRIVFKGRKGLLVKLDATLKAD